MNFLSAWEEVSIALIWWYGPIISSLFSDVLFSSYVCLTIDKKSRTVTAV